MSTSTVPRAGLGQLAAVLDGSLARPGDPNWDAARQAWHLAVDRRPTAVVRAGSVRDVVAVVDESMRGGGPRQPKTGGSDGGSARRAVARPARRLRPLQARGLAAAVHAPDVRGHGGLCPLRLRDVAGVARWAAAGHRRPVPARWCRGAGR